MADFSLKDVNRETRIYSTRILVALCILLAMISIIFIRFFNLQVLQYDRFQTASDRNRVHIQSIAPRRGLIYDRNGELLAENIPSHTLTITRERVKDLDSTLAYLGELLEISDEQLESFHNRLKRHRPFEEAPLKFKLTEEEVAIIAANRVRLPGVSVKAELVRSYPKGELFAHSLGYVGRINERDQEQLDPVNYAATHHIGKIGVERFYEDVLHGFVGYQNVETNARGKVLRVLDRTDPLPGANLTLTLDSRLQQVAHQALGDERGAVVAIEPSTGEVLAFVSTPSYDPNLFIGGISYKNYAALRDSIDLPLFNRAIRGQYPPGSTIKMVMGLAGLESGKFTENTTVHDPGWYQLPNDERFYRDWKREGHADRVNLHQAIEESCDVYFYDLAYKVGIDQMHAMAVRFMLGRRTGIDLIGERRGLMPSRQWKKETGRGSWFPGQSLNVGIGQGYTLTTPLQLAVMTSALANRGKVPVPRLIKSAESGLLEPVVFAPSWEEEISLKKEKHWDIVLDAMEAVVHSRKGTARRLSWGAKYRMAGKTGTAQVVGIAQGEEYDAEALEKRQRDHALFVGFAPVDQPQIAVAVIVENGGSGSGTAAPVAKKVMDAWLLRNSQEEADLAHAG